MQTPLISGTTATGRILRLVLPAMVLTVGLYSPFAVHAEPESVPEYPNGQTRRQEPMREPEQRQRPIPPRIAINACDGKHEGDPCSFRSPYGIREGVCLSGSEHVFACRPHRNAQRQEDAQGAAATEPKAPASGVAADTKQLPAPTVVPLTPASVPQKRVEPPPEQKESPAPIKQTESTVQPPESLKVRATADQPERKNSLFGHPLGYLLIALLTATGTWYWYYRSVMLPLRRLRQVTQQLARGELSARLGEGLTERRDEVADLGRDVDRMAERIESLVSAHQRLIRDVSHELRSPLARLNVALELARQTAGPTFNAPFDRIDRESERLNELISQLLMLTKLENESTTVQRTELDIAALISEVSQDVDFEAQSNDRRVLATIAGPQQLKGNRELLRQALENLVRNAARYTAAGTAVEISLRKRESGGCSWAHIEVRDRGPGVPESELYDIFRPFYRVNDARERQSGGTGVGLAISDRAVRLHGGSLRAFNAPGGGLIMEMELPLA